MSSPIRAASRRRSRLLASSFLLPVLSLSISAAKAQQSASPNLLPSIEVEAPSDKSRIQSAPVPDRSSASRRVVPVRQRKPADAKPAVAPGKEQAVVVSPTATVTPLDQVASSVTVITAKDIERDQRRTLPDALATVPGLNVVQNGGPGGLTSVFTRGTNPNHTKVFIDGIDASDPSNPGRGFFLGLLFFFLFSY